MSKINFPESGKSLFQTYKILTVYSRDRYHDKKKQINKFDSHQLRYNTQHNSDIRLPIPVLTIINDSFIYNDCKIFNHIRKDRQILWLVKTSFKQLNIY